MAYKIYWQVKKKKKKYILTSKKSSNVYIHTSLIMCSLSLEEYIRNW